MRARAGTAGLVLAAVAACGGGSDGRDDYVDALADAFESEDSSMSESDRRCFAEAAVYAVGVAKLDEAASPDEIREAATTDLVAIGVDVAEADGEQFYERYSECVDVREVLIAGAVGSNEITAEAGECLETELSEDLVRRYVVAAFSEGTEEALQNDALAAEIRAAFTACSGGTTEEPPA